MKQTLLSVFFCCLAVFSLAQHPIVVEYDYLNPGKTRLGYLTDKNDTIFFKKRKIRIKGDTPVSFHLINYNSESLKVEAKVKRGINSDSLSGINFLSFFSTIGSFVNVPGVDITKILPKRGPARNEELKRLRPDLEEINRWNFESDIVALDTTIRAKLRQVNNWKIVAREAKKLRENTSLSKAETGKKMIQLLSGLSEDAPVALADENLAALLVRQVARENATYLKRAIVSYSEKVKKRPASRGGLVMDEYDLAEDNIKGYEEYINDKTEPDIQQTLSDISRSYQAVLNNKFEGKLNAILDGNSELVSLNFFQKTGNTDEPKSGQLVHTEPFEISGKGGIRISSSFGISISSYAQDLEEYFVTNGKISSSKGDRLVPSFAAYIQFSGKREAAFKLGGHFGFGIPLTESKGVSFLLGPSLLFGTKNIVCVNLGILTGKVTRLSGGWNLGDSYSAAGVPPTRTRYELGYHAGVSFNISELLRK